MRALWMIVLYGCSDTLKLEPQELDVRLPSRYLDGYEDFVEEHCSKSSRIDNDIHAYHLKDGSRWLNVELSFKNTTKEDVIYIAGPADYGTEVGLWSYYALHDENYPDTVPDVWVRPLGWKKGRIQWDNAAVLKPGDEAIQTLAVSFLCRNNTDVSLALGSSGQTYNGGFLHAHGVCDESEDEIGGAWGWCSPKYWVDGPDVTTWVPVTLTVRD